MLARWFVALAAAWALAPHAVAQDGYPSKALRIVVPFGAGGGSDAIGRLLGQKLSEALRQPVVIDNRPGAGGSIGTREVLRAAPDGYTLLLATSSTHGINPWIYSNIGYDAIKDFAPISMLATSDYALAVPTVSASKTVADLVRLGKSGKIDFASSGNGTTSHLAGALFATLSKTPFVHVPYKSNAPAEVDLIGGQVAFMFNNTSVFLPHAKSGKVRILATSGATRSAAAREIPTMIEAGVPGFDVIGWFCLLAPAATPAPVVAILNREVLRILAVPEMRERITTSGNEVMTTTPAETTAYMTAQLAKYKMMVDAAGAKAD